MDSKESSINPSVNLRYFQNVVKMPVILESTSENVSGSNRSSSALKAEDSNGAALPGSSQTENGLAAHNSESSDKKNQDEGNDGNDVPPPLQQEEDVYKSLKSDESELSSLDVSFIGPSSSEVSMNESGAGEGMLSLMASAPEASASSFNITGDPYVAAALSLIIEEDYSSEEEEEENEEEDDDDDVLIISATTSESSIFSSSNTSSADENECKSPDESMQVDTALAAISSGAGSSNSAASNPQADGNAMRILDGMSFSSQSSSSSSSDSESSIDDFDCICLPSQSYMMPGESEISNAVDRENRKNIIKTLQGQAEIITNWSLLERTSEGRNVWILAGGKSYDFACSFHATSAKAIAAASAKNVGRLGGSANNNKNKNNNNCAGTSASAYCYSHLNTGNLASSSSNILQSMRIGKTENLVNNNKNQIMPSTSGTKVPVIPRPGTPKPTSSAMALKDEDDDDDDDDEDMARDVVDVVKRMLMAQINQPSLSDAGATSSSAESVPEMVESKLAPMFSASSVNGQKVASRVKKYYSCVRCDGEMYILGKYRWYQHVIKLHGVHENRIIGDSLHACSKCGKEFGLKRSRNAHMKTHVSNNITPEIAETSV